MDINLVVVSSSMSHIGYSRNNYTIHKELQIEKYVQLRDDVNGSPST